MAQVVESLRSRLLANTVAPSDPVRRERFALPPRVLRKQNAFACLSVCVYALSFWTLGWRSTLFALWSLSVKASRFDVIGWGQDAAEHDPSSVEHPTFSTYGVWNLLFCNTGYHNEHHTFPAVAGCNLPRITAADPGTFLPDTNPHSYAALWGRWAAAGFRSFRLTAEQLRLARGGRCQLKKHVE